MKCRKAQSESINRTIRNLNGLASDAIEYGYSEHPVYYYTRWSMVHKTVFLISAIIAIVVAVALLHDFPLRAGLVSGSFLTICIVSCFPLLFSKDRKDTVLIRWNSKKTLAKLNNQRDLIAKGIQENTQRAREQEYQSYEQKRWKAEYKKYLKEKTEYEAEAKIYRPRFEALYDIIRVELDGKVEGIKVHDENMNVFMSELEINISLPDTTSCKLSSRQYRFSKEDYQLLLKQVVSLRSFFKECRDLDAFVEKQLKSDND